MSQSTRFFTLTLAAIILSLGLVLSPPAFADMPGSHSMSMRAMSNLQASADLLSRQDEINVMRDQNNALKEINNAMRDIRRALRVDDRFIGEHLFTPVIATRGGRLQRALENLEAARNCMTQEGDNRHAMRERNDATNHIDRAISFVREAMRDDRRDDHHADNHGNHHHQQ
jgi:hypothetical protein